LKSVGFNSRDAIVLEWRWYPKNGVHYAQSPYFETVGQQADFAPNFEIETNLLYLHQT